MALVQVLQVEWFNDNPYGTFVAGDILDIYMETDDAVVPAPPMSGQNAGISVRKNGSVITSGPLAGYDGNTLIHDYNTNICISTTLLKFVNSGTYPYAFYYSLENHPSCSITPVVCDLAVNGIPSVVPASSATTADGSIMVTATSSNGAIQYKLTEDFSYGDGTAQPDGFFGGLLPGDYRVYLRDAKNCSANVLVTVAVSNVYTTKYRLEYTDKKNRPTRIDIKRRGYVGDIIEVKGSTDPYIVSLRGEGSTNKFEPLMAISCDLNLVSETDSQFLEIYTNDANLFRIEYSKDTGSGLDLKLTTKVLPHELLEDYKAPPSFVSVTSIDGLSELKNYYLIQKDGQKYYGTVKLIKLIAYCLSTIKLDLPIRVACNMYALAMNITASDDPLDQAYCDYERFYLAEKEPTLDFVLRSILETFGCRITQWEGRWHIVRVEQMVNTYAYRDFDKDGIYLSNSTFNPVMDLNYPVYSDDLMLAHRDHSLQLLPGYGVVRVLYNLGLKPNIFKNGNFRLNSVYNSLYNTYSYSINTEGWTLVNGGYPIEETYEQIDDSNVAYKIIGRGTITGNAYLQSEFYDVTLGVNNQLKFTIRFKATDPTFGTGNLYYSPDVPYFKLRVVVEYGGLYLKSDGYWSTTLNELVFHFTEYNKYHEIDFLANQPRSDTTLTGDDLRIKVYHVYTYHAQFSSVASLKSFQTYDAGESAQVISTGYKTELFTSELAGAPRIYFYVLQETTEANDEYNIIRPNDYNGSTNPRQWVRQQEYATSFQNDYLGLVYAVHGMCIDKIVCEYLTNGKAPEDTIVRSTAAESQNTDVLEKTFILGSYGTIFQTEVQFNLDLGFFFPPTTPGANIQIVNYLSFDLLYTGWLRSSSGTGYENWKRLGIGESDKIHGIILKSIAAQYRRSWRLLRGSVFTNNYFGLLNVLRNVNDSNRIYLPMGVELNDHAATISGEFHELIDITSSGGSDGSGSAPYSSGFSRGFGSSGFN